MHIEHTYMRYIDRNPYSTAGMGCRCPSQSKQPRKQFLATRFAARNGSIVALGHKYVPRSHTRVYFMMDWSNLT